MKPQTKLVILARHGETPTIEGKRQDYITDESVRQLYSGANALLSDHTRNHGIIPQERTLIAHSPESRTVYSGKALLAGALSLKPVPTSINDLDKLDFSSSTIDLQPNLGYDHIRFNEREANKDPSNYLQNWFANPKSTVFKGEEITPYQDVLTQARKTLTHNLSTLINNGKDLAAFVSHSGIVEALMISLLNTQENHSVKSFDEIGGPFNRGDFASLWLNRNVWSGNYKGTLVRNNVSYRVDLSTL